MFLYYLFIEGAMKDDDIHIANDDCAICRAWTKKQAINKFLAMYPANDSNVFRVRFNKSGIAVLTDY